MSLSSLDFSAAKVFLVLFDVRLDRTEFSKQLVVLQYLNILHMEVRFIITLESLVRLAGVDALEDAELAEVLQRHLQLVDSGRARHVPTR